MDFAIYRAVVQYVYKLDEQIRLEGVDGAPLLAFLATLKDKPSCRLDAKQAMVYRYLSNSDLDVLCLQEAGGLDWT